MRAAQQLVAESGQAGMAAVRRQRLHVFGQGVATLIRLKAALFCLLFLVGCTFASAKGSARRQRCFCPTTRSLVTKGMSAASARRLKPPAKRNAGFLWGDHNPPYGQDFSRAGARVPAVVTENI